MADITLSVKVTRSLLGLGDLELNDHLNYYVAPGFLGGQTTWRRQQVTSPFLDGSITVNRTRDMVADQLTVEVKGASQSVVATNLGAVVAAISQDSFNLVVSVGGALYQWQCEASDYSMSWEGPRLISRQVQLHIALMRQPVPVAGPL